MPGSIKHSLKSALQALHVYHPLQTAYRSGILLFTRQYYRLVYVRYKGRGFRCNYCEVLYERFVPEYPPAAVEKAINDNHVIAGYGENVFCPNCLCKNRERLIKAVLQAYLPVEGRKVLHFSPEKHLFQFINQLANVTTVDLIPGFYRNIDSQIVYADATRLDFSTGFFDLLIANHILEHIPDDLAAMREMFRVIKENGVAILQVPYSETLSATIEEPDIDDPARQAALYGQKDHVRIYALTDYIKRLEKAGFHVRLLTPDMLSPFRMYATQKNESVILCYKQ